MADSEAGRPGRTPGGGWVPVPDPTALTSQAIASITGEYRREIRQLRELIETRLDARDKADEAHLKDMGQLRRQLEEKITHLGELGQEKFDGIDRRFRDRDERLEQHNETGEKALVAALDSAQKLSDQHDRSNEEATRLAQTATSEQIRSLEQVTAADRQALRDLIEDARTRLTTIESLTRGLKEAGGEQREVRGEQRASLSTVIAAVATLVAVISFVLYVTKH